MKKRYKVLAVFGAILLFWIGTMVYNNILTHMFEEEFKDFKAMEYDFMHPWEEEPKISVLSYSSKKATVYFFSETGGEKTLFFKEDGKWKYEKTLAIWTSAEQGGNASDYFIWPYFRDYVP